MSLHKANGGKTSTKECVLLFLPSPGGHPQVGMDPGAEPGRDYRGVEQGLHEGAAQPRAARPFGGKNRGRPGTSTGPQAPAVVLDDRGVQVRGSQDQECAMT